MEPRQSNAVNAKLTPAARRDLAALRAGEDVACRYGPWEQLRDAGYVTGTQWHPVLTDKGRNS